MTLEKSVDVPKLSGVLNIYKDGFLKPDFYYFKFSGSQFIDMLQAKDLQEENGRPIAAFSFFSFEWISDINGILISSWRCYANPRL